MCEKNYNRTELIPVSCWCGSLDLQSFSSEYYRCNVCETLVVKKRPSAEELVVRDDVIDFYGKEYWFNYEKQRNLPNIFERTRADLPERCSYWLRFILKYVSFGSKTLELGCGNGGLVYMMRLAGYDSAGIEMSPWICNYIRTTFEVPVYQGPLEDADFPDESLDAVIMLDVLEHLPNPVTVLNLVRKKLKQDGILVIQTPQYMTGLRYDELVENKAPFLTVLQPEEHLFLFSEHSGCRLLKETGFPSITQEPAIFPYDMFLFASRKPLIVQTKEEVIADLCERPAGRLVQALLDSCDERESLRKQLTVIDADREARLEQICTLTDMLHKQLALSDADRANLLEQIHTLTDMVHKLQQK